MGDGLQPGIRVGRIDFDPSFRSFGAEFVQIVVVTGGKIAARTAGKFYRPLDRLLGLNPAETSVCIRVLPLSKDLTEMSCGT